MWQRNYLRIYEFWLSCISLLGSQSISGVTVNYLKSGQETCFLTCLKPSWLIRLNSQRWDVVRFFNHFCSSFPKCLLVIHSAVVTSLWALFLLNPMRSRVCCACFLRTLDLYPYGLYSSNLWCCCKYETSLKTATANANPCFVYPFLRVLVYRLKSLSSLIILSPSSLRIRSRLLLNR